jgi:hypothetical protein
MFMSAVISRAVVRSSCHHLPLPPIKRVWCQEETEEDMGMNNSCMHRTMHVSHSHKSVPPTHWMSCANLIFHLWLRSNPLVDGLPELFSVQHIPFAQVVRKRLPGFLSRMHPTHVVRLRKGMLVVVYVFAKGFR